MTIVVSSIVLNEELDTSYKLSIPKFDNSNELLWFFSPVSLVVTILKWFCLLGHELDC